MSINLKTVAEAIQIELMLKEVTGEISGYREEYIPEKGEINFDIVKVVNVPAKYIEVKCNLKLAGSMIVGTTESNER